MKRFLCLTVVALLLLPGCVKPRAWKAALQKARATGVIEVDARLGGDSRFCADVVSKMRAPGMVRCSPDADISVDVDLSVGSLDHSWDSRRHSRDYVAGVYEVENPARRDAMHEFRVASRALASAEERLAMAKDAGKPTDELEDLVRSRRSARERADRELASTPRFVERTEMAEYRWTAVHHTWSAPYDWTAKLDAAGARLSRNGSGALMYRGVDQRGFEPAEVRALRAHEPASSQVRGEAYGRTVTGVARMLDDQLDRAAALREGQCPPTPRLTDDADWLACRAEVKLLRGKPAFHP